MSTGHHHKAVPYVAAIVGAILAVVCLIAWALQLISSSSAFYPDTWLVLPELVSAGSALFSVGARRHGV